MGWRAHAAVDVALTEEQARDEGDGPSRDEFAHEDDRASVRTVGRGGADVEPEVHLLKGAVPWDRDSPKSGVGESEADQTDDVRVLPGVELRAARDEGLEEAGGAIVVQENQALPAGRQERTGQPALLEDDLNSRIEKPCHITDQLIHDAESGATADSP